MQLKHTNKKINRQTCNALNIIKWSASLNTIYAQTKNTNLKMLQTIIKTDLRSIFEACRTTPINNLMKETRISPLKQIVVKENKN